MIKSDLLEYLSWFLILDVVARKKRSRVADQLGSDIDAILPLLPPASSLDRHTSSRSIK
jgi:hypothetical protein